MVVGYGPFRDEAFYVTSGLQLWAGAPYPAERYLNWFNGSPYMWPALSGAAFGVGGLVAARLLALAAFSTAVWLAWRATDLLLGAGPARGAVLIVLLQGSSLILAHYATYDLGSYPCAGLALWCIARGHRSPRSWPWAAAAGLAMWLTALSKYGYAVMGLPLVLTVWAAGGRHRIRDMAIFGVTAGVPFLMSMQLQFGTWIPPTLGNYDHATFFRILVATVVGVYVVIPLALTLFGAREADADARTRRLLYAGVAGLLMWPILQALSGQIASAFKHAWLGVLVAAPGVGYGFHRLWEAAGRRARLASAATLVGVAAVMWTILEPLTYPNFRPSVDFLMDRVAEGDSVFVVGDNDRWVYAMYLYAADRVDSPFDVVDQDPGALAETCTYAWVASTRTGVTGGLDSSAWTCPYELVFERRQPFLNYRGRMDIQTSMVHRRVGGRARSDGS